ncbi:MAG: hypothetical protein M3H12_18350, partial [Chromatiales bacterium]
FRHGLLQDADLVILVGVPVTVIAKLGHSGYELVCEVYCTSYNCCLAFSETIILCDRAIDEFIFVPFLLLKM